MTILITGGTGKTGSRLARRLVDANYPVLLTSRKGVVLEPFKGIKRIYIVAPDGGRAGEVIEPMKPFIDLAVTKGVNRFVLLSATILEAGGPVMGKVHEYLLSLQVDYAILRPSWFYENLLTVHLHDIKENNTIATASVDGKLDSCLQDLVFEALIDAKSHNTDHILTACL
ncbi:hypothetical protein IW262DRAFT_1460185 [Armillaria fumosa]|nr:hypothetical protein IW262DRAFT_1460185 [Armillaria fumosa]